MVDNTHETVDRAVDVTEMTVDQASDELLKLLPGDDAVEGEPEIPPDDDEQEGDDKKDDRESKNTKADAEDEADDEQEGTEGDDEEFEDVEVFMVPVAGGGEEEVTLEELGKGYSRQSDYTRKTQQLADRGREMDSELADTRNVRQEYGERLKMLNTTLDDMSPSDIDWDQVKRDDPDNYSTRYTDHQRQEAKREALRAEATRVEQENQEENAASHKRLLVEERMLLEKALPAFADPEKAQALTTELADYAESQFGVNRSEFDHVHNHLIMRLLNDSMELKKLQSKTSKIVAKRIKGKRVVRPGARPVGSTVRRKTVRRAKDAYMKLAKTGSVEDATALFMDMDD